jgi:hypothetical protein
MLLLYVKLTLFEIQKPKQPQYIKSICNARSDRWGSHGYDRIFVGFTSTYAIIANHP